MSASPALDGPQPARSRAAKLTLRALAAASVLLLLACGEGASPGTTVPPEATPTISIIPYEGPVICADGSTESFAGAQAEARFQLYCPTYVPAGFIFDGIELDEPPGAPAGSVMARASFRRSDPPGELQFLQGQPGLAALTEIIMGKEVQDTIAYSDFPANLFEDAVLARSSEGYTQIITSAGIRTDELRQVAGGMQRVPGLLPTSTAVPTSQ